MAGTDADSGDARPAAEEWRVDLGETAQPAAAPAGSEREWAQTAVSRHRDRVRADLGSWNEELAERVRRLEERLDGSATR